MKEIIEYQRLDAQIFKLEREKNNLEEKNVMNKMIAFVKDAQNKSVALENEGKGLLNEYNNLKSEYNSLSKDIQKLINEKISDKESIDDIDASLVQANTLSSKLFMVERNINIIITKIRDLLKGFEQTKNNAIKARAKHKEAKENYSNKVSEIEPKIEELKKQQKILEKSINPDVFEKYKVIKNDGIFPVFVKVKMIGTSILCGGCGMEVPKGKADVLKNNKYIQCEQCRRIILSE